MLQYETIMLLVLLVILARVVKFVHSSPITQLYIAGAFLTAGTTIVRFLVGPDWEHGRRSETQRAMGRSYGTIMATSPPPRVSYAHVVDTPAKPGMKKPMQKPLGYQPEEYYPQYVWDKETYENTMANIGGADSLYDITPGPLRESYLHRLNKRWYKKYPAGGGR